MQLNANTARPASGRFSQRMEGKSRDRGAEELSNERAEDALGNALKHAADRWGCSFVFELQPEMIGAKADKAAVILCPRQDGPAILFLLIDHDTAHLRFIEEEEAPAPVVDFCWSYISVLAHFTSGEQNRLQ
jgi:hypothetical protein